MTGMMVSSAWIISSLSSANASKRKKNQMLEQEIIELKAELAKERAQPINERLYEIQQALNSTQKGFMKAQEAFKQLQSDVLNQENTK